MAIGDSLAVYQNNLAIANARIAELTQDVKERAEATQENYEIILKLREQIAELERKLAEQQAIVANFFSMYGVDVTDRGLNELNNLLAKAKEEATNTEATRWAARLNFIHTEFDVDGSGVDSGDPLDVIESEIKQAFEKVEEEVRREAVPDGCQVVPNNATTEMWLIGQDAATYE